MDTVAMVGHGRAIMVCSLAMNLFSSLFLAFMFLTWGSKDLPIVIGLFSVIVFLVICPLLSIASLVLSYLDRKDGVRVRMGILSILLALLYPLYLIIFLVKLSTFELHVM
jgi:hypothetical protein